MARFRVGLTGGIASGKSAADAAFAELGVFVADADVIARELVAPGQPALDEIVAHFGSDMLTPEGALDRPALRQRIFANPADKLALESILHPRIRIELEARTAAAPGDIAIAAIPLLAEGGGRKAYPWLQRILVVDVAEPVQLQRLLQRDGIDEALARRMIAVQATRRERLLIADDVLVNDRGLAEIGQKVAALDRLYRSLATSPL